MIKYKCLKNSVYSFNEFKIVPIRYNDRFIIMNWRNEQMYHLRQNKPLTEKDQNDYFNHIVNDLFNQDKPTQILFSLLKNNNFIGYGGLVHINWVDYNAEISFLIQKNLEIYYFEKYWSLFLTFIKKIAFDDLNFKKVYTYAFDVRPHLYKILENNNFIQEAVLEDHCLIENQFKNVVIHSFFNKLKLRKVEKKDLNKTFEWCNDKRIRRYSFNQIEVPFKEHKKWFLEKIQNENSLFYILENSLGTEIGSVRVDKTNDTPIEFEISYLIDVLFQGYGIGKLALELLEKEVKFSVGKEFIHLKGIVKSTNIPSLKTFRSLNYSEIKEDGNIKFTKII